MYSLAAFTSKAVRQQNKKKLISHRIFLEFVTLNDIDLTMNRPNLDISQGKPSDKITT
jgi:hypothetical protein